MADQIGAISPGRQADIVLVEGNPVANFKRLYGTGHYQLNRETNELERVGGVRYTIKAGVVYDAKALLADVRQLVASAKEASGTDGAHEEH
jgi:imidazolonepropionase-like amidohydrolase